MTDDMEQIIRRGYELWNQGDYEGMTAFFHPEVEIDATRRVLNPARYHGLEGLAQLTNELFDVWEEWSIDPTRFVWNGNRVFVETRITVRGKGSGIRLEETYYTVYTLEDAKGTAMEIHLDEDEALASAGLPPAA